MYDVWLIKHATALMSYIPGTVSHTYYKEMSNEPVLTDSVTDRREQTTVVSFPKSANNEDGEDIDTSSDNVDAAATRRVPQKLVPPMTDAKSLAGEDDTDIDPAKLMEQSIRELEELSISSKLRLSSLQKEHLNLNNNIPVPAAPRNPKTTPKQSNYVYNMQHKHRGKAVIINNINFQPFTRMNKRSGSQRDADYLIEILDKLGFNVQAHTDLTIKKTRAVLKSISRHNHENSDCLLFVIMTHGEEDALFCVDGTIPVDDITEPFKGDKCPSLAGKPKIFFIQACRGQKLDGGVEIGVEEVDAALPVKNRQLIPAEADFLVGYSSPQGYYSWRNQGIGAWFIQAILSVLNDHGTELEIQQMMTRVNHIVAYEYMSNCSIPGFDQKKQVPCIVSTLTKELYFKPKTTDDK